MLDIIPATPSAHKKARRPRRDDTAVVTLNWKLPSRLRKPIRQQLAKERQQKRQQQAIVRFERRPVITSHIEAKPGSNIGVEHHTGDVYRHSKPLSRVSLPPYAGRYARKLTNPPVAPKVQALKSVRPITPPVQASKVVRPKASLPPRKASVVFSQERDVPFNWKTVASVQQVTEESKPASSPTFSLPLTFSIWPISLLSGVFGKKKISSSKPSGIRRRGKTFNIAILLVGCLISVGLVSNLRTLGRSTSALAPIQERAQKALAQLDIAQTALAQTDFVGSEKAFAGAQQELQQAQADFDKAFSTSKEMLRLFDITGTVASGEELLATGEHITAAGQYISRGIGALLTTTDVLPDQKENTSPSKTLVDAVNVSRQELSNASQELQAAQKSLAQVKSVFLPDQVQQQVDRLNEILPPVDKALRQYVEQSDTLLEVLGADRGKQYLIVFANNHELRPVGGFLGSIALVNIDRGKVENIDVKSVYDPDGQLKEFIAPPNPLLAITNRWYLRDANWFVSYPPSAAKITEFFEKEGGSTVDGVILLTPEVIRNLLRITGPLEVPGYDIQVTPENFYEVTQDQVTYNYDRTVNRPKQFLSDLTPLLLNKLMSDEKVSKLAVLQALRTSVTQKDLLLYFRDRDIQTHIKEAGWSGDLPADAPGFLMINNANIGGHKSDQFVEQEADYRAQVQDNGDVDVVLTIRRTHHGPKESLSFNYPAGENPAYKDNIIYQRVLVPQGAHLIEAQGYTPAGQIPHPIKSDPTLPVKPDADVVAWQQRQQEGVKGTLIGSEEGYTSFANWVVTKPGQTTVTLYHYTLPAEASFPTSLNPAARYSLYIAKQSGQIRSHIRASLTIPAAYSIVHRVPVEGVTQENDQSLVYRGDITRDIVVGAVYEKNR